MNTSRALAFRLPAAVVLGAGLCFSLAAAAGPTRFNFTLTNPDSLGQTFDGEGHFVVNDPIPSSGTAVVVASDLRGVVGGTWLFSPPAEFGYAFGNSFEFFIGDPAERNLEVITWPHEDARITFIDGLPLGISYRESHACDTGHHCIPERFMNVVGSMSMDGLMYSDSAHYLDGGGGFITITAVPEPASHALLLAGLLTLGFKYGMARSRRLAGDRRSPVGVA